MGKCSKEKQKLLLDVHGALDDYDRVELETHLSACRDCRNERERLLALLGEIREASEPPELCAAETNALVEAVRGRLKPEPKGWSQKLFSGSRLSFIPVAAAACLVVIASFLAYRTLTTDRGIGGPTQQQYQVTRQDLEVIRHLELLRNMDTIQKLVNIVDENDRGIPVDEFETDMHGMRHNQYRGPYA